MNLNPKLRNFMAFSVVRGALSWALAAPRVALGQASVSLDRLDPTLPSAAFVSVADPEVDSAPRIELGASYSHAHAPLVLSDEGRDVTVVRTQGLSHLQLGFRLGVLPLEVGLHWPVALVNRGKATDIGGVPIAMRAGVASGEPQLRLLWTLAGQRGPRPALALLGRLALPVAGERRFLGGAGARLGAQALVGADYENFLYRVSLGRDATSYAEDALVGSEFTLRGAAGVRWRSLVIGPEMLTALRTGEQGSLASSNVGAELLATAHYGFDAWSARVAGGKGLSQAPGTPDWRVVVSVGWNTQLGPGTPREPDETSEPATRDKAQAPKPPGAPVRFGDASDGSALTRVPIVQALDSAGPGESSGASAPRAAPAAHRQKPTAQADRDRDGITDVADACPDAFGTSSAPGQVGCPKDSDADGVWDHEDACPKEKGVAGPHERSGCAKEARVLGTQIAISEQVQFESGATVISAASEPLLRAIADVLIARPDIVRVAIEGHTDNVGPEQRNLAVSRERAVAVARWLAAHGVDARRLQVRAFGPRRPKAPNDSEEGRKANRRVEFTILHQDERGSEAWLDGPVPSRAQVPSETQVPSEMQAP